MSEASSNDEETSCVVDEQDDTDDVMDGSGAANSVGVDDDPKLRADDGSSGTDPPKHVKRRSVKARFRDSGGRLEADRTVNSRRSARECRVRRTIRYQYVADMVTSRERAIITLRQELEVFRKCCAELDAGNVPKALPDLLETNVD